MMGRLYADEDFPFGAVELLRNLGYDVLTVQEAGRCGRPDTDVLADATVRKLDTGEPFEDVTAIAEALVHADLILTALTGEPSTFGKKALEGLANLGGLYGTKSLYENLAGGLREHVDYLTCREALENALRIMREAPAHVDRHPRTGA